MLSYLKLVNFKVINVIEATNNKECVAIEYKFSNKIYWLLKPAPGQAKKMTAHKLLSGNY